MLLHRSYFLQSFAHVLHCCCVFTRRATYVQVIVGAIPFERSCVAEAWNRYVSTGIYEPLCLARYTTNTRCHAYYKILSCYSQFTDNVFFLDTIERVRTSDDQDEQRRLEVFKDFQLRARDGLLVERDWEYVRSLGAGAPAGFFSGPNVTCLKPTRAARNLVNAEHVEALVATGMPCKLIKAINSGREIAEADEDDMMLPSLLVLAIGEACVGGAVLLVACIIV